jgi:hypothetical protein
MKQYIKLTIVAVVCSYNSFAQNAKKSNYFKNYKFKNIVPKSKPASALTQYLDTIYISPQKTLIVAFTNNQKISFLNMDCNQISNEIINDNTAIALKLKTPSKGFEETNVVINANDKYYGYVIRYVPQQREIVHYLDPSNSLEKQAKFRIANLPSSPTASGLMQNNGSTKTILASNKIQHVFDSVSNVILERTDESDGKFTYQTGDCKLSLLSTHVYQDKIYFAVRITNRSSISYDIDFIKFGTKFINKSKNQAIQETEISPIYEYNSHISKVQSDNTVEKVFVFEKFTIDKKTKKFKVEAWEKNGERPLIVFYPSNKITNAEIL